MNWELHHPRNNLPKWYRGARTAKLVLDKSDPGYRYQRPVNVQSSHARHVLGNLIAMYDILCQVVCPLNLEEVKNQYPWLLEGNEREVRRIVGLTGMSPKLLHTIGQISHLAARLNHDPESTVVPIAGKIIEDRLNGFHQWSDLSEGHASAEALLASCVLDQDGKVSCAVAVNELTAESYVAMAQIYLQCRVFRYGFTSVLNNPQTLGFHRLLRCPVRKSRRHTDVQSSLRVLLQCISRLPTSGFLYTAQGAVLRTLVAGIVAVDPQHRDIIRGLFVKTVKGPRGVSVTQVVVSWLIPNNRAFRLAGGPSKTSGFGRTQNLTILKLMSIQCWQAGPLGGRLWLRGCTRKRVGSMCVDTFLDYTLFLPIAFLSGSQIIKSFSSRSASPFPFTVPLCFRFHAHRLASSISSSPFSICTTDCPRIGRNFHPWNEPAVAT